jgi:hypothetical protein
MYFLLYSVLLAPYHTRILHQVGWPGRRARHSA